MTAEQRKATPKTGLAGRIRMWASRQKGAFSAAEICYGLDVPYGQARDRVRNAIPDFVARGEMRRCSTGVYQYVHARRRQAEAQGAPLRHRLIKACYVGGPAFTVSDLMRWAEAGDRGYVQQVLRGLVRSGHVILAGFRKIPKGRENLYRIPDRNRFRKELL